MASHAISDSVRGKANPTVGNSSPRQQIARKDLVRLARNCMTMTSRYRNKLGREFPRDQHDPRRAGLPLGGRATNAGCSTRTYPIPAEL
jgi:hypothetical protein